MPKLAGEHFDYTPEGVNEAKQKSKKTGNPVKYSYGLGKGNELSGNKPRKSSRLRRNSDY